MFFESLPPQNTLLKVFLAEVERGQGWACYTLWPNNNYWWVEGRRKGSFLCNKGSRFSCTHAASPGLQVFCSRAEWENSLAREKILWAHTPGTQPLSGMPIQAKSPFPKLCYLLPTALLLFNIFFANKLKKNENLSFQSKIRRHHLNIL